MISIINRTQQNAERLIRKYSSMTNFQIETNETIQYDLIINGSSAGLTGKFKPPSDFLLLDKKTFFYDLNSFAPSVRSHIEKLTTKRTKQKHDDIKSPRYWNSIGRINERRIKDKKRRIEAEVQERLAEERAEQYHNNGPLKKRVYAKWVNPHTVGN